MKTNNFCFGYFLMGTIATGALYFKADWWALLPGTILGFILWIGDALGEKEE